MKMKPLLFAVLSLTMITLVGCVSATEDNNNTSATTNENITVSNQNVTETEKTPTPNTTDWSSRSKSIQFQVNKNWKCVETVYDERIDCYPTTRQSEEYDAGLDQPIVYMPNITIWNKNCILDNSKTINSEPSKIEKEGVGVSYEFYKQYGDCLVTITTNADISTNETLEEIIITTEPAVSTYVNQEHNFSLEYPTGFNINTSTSSGPSVDNNYLLFEIGFKPADVIGEPLRLVAIEHPLDKWNELDSFSLGSVTSEQMYINGRTWHVLENATYKIVATENENRTYLLIMDNDVTSEQQWSEANNTILYSFELNS